MAFDFILMLTAKDRTIPDASARLEQALEGGVRHIGFKDVGLPIAELTGLAATIRAAGGRSYLEVVSLDEEQELASARAAVELDVDCLLGGTRAGIVTGVIRDHPICYYPFPGHVTGHPSILEGPASEIVASAQRLADLEHVHGLDLLAYRHHGNVPELIRGVCKAVAKPVIVAGGIDRDRCPVLGPVADADRIGRARGNRHLTRSGSGGKFRVCTTTSMRRWRLTSAATADSPSDQRGGVFTCWRGNAAGLGGWTFVTRLSLAMLQATGMAFFGLYGSTAAFATTLTLSVVVSCIGIGFQRGTHSRWQLVANDASGAPTLVDMGASFAIATGGVLTLTIAAAPNASSGCARSTR